MKKRSIRLFEDAGVASGLLTEQMLNYEIEERAVNDLEKRGLPAAEIKRILRQVATIMDAIELEAIDGVSIVDGVVETNRVVDQVSEVDGVQVLAAQVEAASMETLREMTDWLRDRLGSSVVVLGANIGGKPGLVAAVTPDLVERGLHAGTLVKEVASVVGGGGGGRPTLAQAGGRDLKRLGEALDKVADLVKRR